MKTYKPKTIIKAIEELEIFLECDLYTRFRPEQKLPIGKNGKNEIWYRDSKDVFKSEKDFVKYLNEHFKILIKQVKKLNSTNISNKTK